MALKQAIKKVALEWVHRNNEDYRRQVLGDGHHLDTQLWDMKVSAAGRLTTSGCDLGQLAQVYGTPLYVVDGNRLARNYREFLGAFRAWYPRVEIGYSYKTNPLPEVLRAIHQMGGYAEVISHFELWLAIELGVPPEKIIFNGPAKTEAALELAVAYDIGMINIDSENEIEPIARLASKYGRRQKVGVRVVTSVGWASQFGVPLAGGRALAAYEHLSAVLELDPRGVHIHLGTGIRDIGAYCQAIGEVMDFAVELKSRLGIELSCLDFGGGFGIPTVQNYSFWDNKLLLNGYPPRLIDIKTCSPLEEYARAIFSMLQVYFARHSWLKPTIFFEPGRAISSSAQSLLLSVLNIKPGAGDKNFAIVDGGKNITVPLGYEHHEVFAVARMHEPAADKTFNIAGPLCYPQDILFKEKRFPELRRGDVLAVMDAGAYFVPNQQNFSNPRPAVVFIDDQGKVRLIRERESFQHIVALDRRVSSPHNELMPIAIAD